MIGAMRKYCFCLPAIGRPYDAAGKSVAGLVRRRLCAMTIAAAKRVLYALVPTHHFYCEFSSDSGEIISFDLAGAPAVYF